MRVVITGATGFIGSNLARVFLEQGAEVFALVRPGSSHISALLSHENLHVVFKSLDCVMDCVDEIGQADGFFHFAWGGVNHQRCRQKMWQAPWNVCGLPQLLAAGFLWMQAPGWNTV